MDREHLRLDLDDDSGDWEPGPSAVTVATIAIGLVLTVLMLVALFGRT